jgi:hypothetical protein
VTRVQQASIGSKFAALLGLALLATTSGCRPAADTAAAVCQAVNEERFEDALALSESLTTTANPDRSAAECRCIAFLSLGEKAACTAFLGPLLEAPEASDWVPHRLLSRLLVRTWREQGRQADAARLATRFAGVHRQDLDLLQLELMLRTATEDEAALLSELEARIDETPESIPQRLVTALAWARRSEYANALRVLGETPPPIEHPLLLPWFESRIEAQAASNDLAAVQASFAAWRSTGWAPIDLEARYALRLSVAQLVDPESTSVERLRAALVHQDRLEDRKLVWGLHRRLITDLLAANRPEEALAAYDAAVQVVSIEGIGRAEIERAVGRKRGDATISGTGRLRFELPDALAGGTLLLSPDPDRPPDAGYRALPVSVDETIEIETTRGDHPRRYVLRDASGAIRGSGALWPEVGQTVVSSPELRESTRPASWSAAARAPADGRRRVFAILPDCGDWRITEYLRARGELPFHDHLFEHGYRAVMESRPAFTAAALQSLVWPGKAAHSGALGWVHHLGLELAGLESVGSNPVGWLSLLLPERPNLFETLGAGPLVTANMLMAHGRIDAGRHAEVVGPHGRRGALPSQSAYRTLDASERARYPALLVDGDTRKFAETIAAEMDAAEEIARSGQVDFLFLRLEALDLITHAHFAPLDGRGQDDAAGALTSAYRYIDERLAALHALLDEDDWLVVLSDHGIRSSMEHEEDAIFVALGDGVPTGRAEGRPGLRGVPRSLAAMLRVPTSWPSTGTTPWLDPGEEDRRVASRRP